MKPKSTVLAIAIVAAALADLPSVALSAPIGPVQSPADTTYVAATYYRGHHYRSYSWYRPYGPYYYGSYAYQPEYGYQSCPYYGHQNLWWCH